MTMVPASPFNTNLPEQTLALATDHARYIFTSRGGGLKTVELTGYPEVISLRWQKDHCLHDMLEHLLGTLGTSRADMVAWGCELRLDKDGFPPTRYDEK